MGSAASASSVKYVEPVMATALAAIEDAITCCICFNVYRDPHALPCLHTLCKPCIDGLADRGKVECPECREASEVSKIRKDFKTQSLIDAPGGSRRGERSQMLNGYLKLIANRYQLTYSADYNMEIRGIYIIQNKIWYAAFNTGIRICDKNMKEENFIKTNYVTGITEWQGNVIVACDNNWGLLQFNSHGIYVSRITYGNYSDVSRNGRYVYGLRCVKPYEIMVYTCAHGTLKWARIGEIQLYTCAKQSLFDKLIVNVNSLLISLCAENCIQMFSLEGALLQTFGGIHTMDLNGPVLASVDIYDNWLVADKDNKQLKVYNFEKKEWHVVPVEFDLRPRHAVVDENNIWVVTDSYPARILKFTKM